MDEGGYDSGYPDSSTEEAGACLDDTGAAPDCTADAGIACNAACNHYAGNYKAGVARDIANCLLKLPSCESPTQDNEIAACVQSALARACADTTADTFCTPHVAQCVGTPDGGGPDGGSMAGLEQMECRELATGLNSAGRAAFTTCLQNGMGTGYCRPDPTTCIDNIE
jgi:hypothetical protein